MSRGNPHTAASARRRRPELLALMVVTFAFGLGSGAGLVESQLDSAQAEELADAGNAFAHFAFDSDPHIIQAHFVTPEFFAKAGIDPAFGRVFADADLRPDADPVVILSQELFERLAEDGSAVLGETVSLSGMEVEVIGVMPKAFDAVDGADLWLPQGLEQRMTGPASRWM